MGCEIRAVDARECKHLHAIWVEKRRCWCCPSCGSTRLDVRDDWRFPESFADVFDESAKTEVVSPGVDQIPFEGIEAIGAVFSEGAVKYGTDNWKRGVDDEAYQRERCRHAIRHLMLWANGDRSEPHLAKVAWFCVTQIWIERRQ